jgi:hypothetical protein
VHGRSGRKHLSEVYESRRWVVEEGQEPRLVTTAFDRNRLILAAVRASNVAADILDGLDDWERQKNRIRREQRQALGPGHSMRIERGPNGQQDRPVLHALSTDGLSTLCGVDASTMDRYLVPQAKAGEPDHELLFEDSNRKYHCKDCHVASGLAPIT